MWVKFEDTAFTAQSLTYSLGLAGFEESQENSVRGFLAKTAWSLVAGYYN